MLLRRITTHVRAQNWFAVGLDFIIVVLGVAIAMMAQEWLSDRQRQEDMRLAEAAIERDLLVNYFHAKERAALSACRIEAIQNVSEKLLEPTPKWTGLPRPEENDPNLNQAMPALLRSPSRGWGSRSWQAELARGTFNDMENDRRSSIDQIFEQSRRAEALQTGIWDLQGRLKTLALSTTIDPSDRLRYLDMLGELDVKSAVLEHMAGQMIVSIEAVDLNHESIVASFDTTDLVAFNAAAQGIYGDCYAPIEFPGLGTRDTP